MLPHWGNQPQYSSESAGDTGDTISGPSVTWPGNQQTQESYSLHAQSSWPQNSQIQESHSLQAHLQWPGNQLLQESHSLQAHPGLSRDSEVYDYESRPGPSSWPCWQLPGHDSDDTPDVAALPHTQSFLPQPHVQIPRPRLHQSLYHRVLGGIYDYEPLPSSNFNEAWPQAGSQPPLQHDIPIHPAFPSDPNHPTDPQPVMTLDPVIYENLPLSVVPSQQAGPSLGTNASSHRDPIDDDKSHSRLLNTYGKSYPSGKPDPGPAPKEPAMKIVPWGTSDLVLECQEEMKRRLFNDSLLPTKATIASLADASWVSTVQRQSRDDLRIWATACSKDFRINKLASVVDEIQGAMQQVIRIFVCYEYDLLFDYAAIVDESRVGERRTRVRGLIANDAFLSAIQSVQGVNTSIPFSNSGVIAFASYILYDSDFRYHQYISEDWNLLPLLTATATFYRWALLERSTDSEVRNFVLKPSI
ncbi:hypothetical protein BD769DRAFT_1386445 [Suillus cothurnatus]|nr:hypothetical protein BD769DRAFT_1386445 [Suillus cothurnatus]